MRYNISNYLIASYLESDYFSWQKHSETKRQKDAVKRLDVNNNNNNNNNNNSTCNSANTRLGGRRFNGIR